MIRKRILKKSNLRLILWLLMAAVSIMLVVGFIAISHPHFMTPLQTSKDQSAEAIVENNVSVKSQKTIVAAPTPLIVEQNKPAPAQRPSGFMTAKPEDVFHEFLKRFDKNLDPVDLLSLLHEVFALLQSLPPEKAVDILIAFLESNEDIVFDLPFRVGVGGNLNSWSSLRVAALDWLGQLSSVVAAQYAKVIFDNLSNPDEWAIAIRNYGRTVVPGTDVYFSQVIKDMFTREDWLEEPTSGFVEALDAIVYAQEYDLLPFLVSHAKNNSSHLRYVAEMVLDAFVQYNRESTFDYLESNLNRFDNTPLLRAKLVSRADVRSSLQLNFIERYLLQGNIGLQEKKDFLRIFPNFSRFLGHRILTQDHIFSMNERAAIDVAALNAVDRWLDDSRFIDISVELYNLKESLIQIVASATTGGYVIK